MAFKFHVKNLDSVHGDWSQQRSVRAARMLLPRLLSRVINPESGVGSTGVWTLEAMRKLGVGQRDVRTKTPAAAPRVGSQGKIQESFIRCVRWDGAWMMPWFSNCCCDTLLDKGNLGRKGLFQLTLTSHTPSMTEPWRNSAYIPSLWLGQLVFLYNPGSPAWGWHHLTWAEISYIS